MTARPRATPTTPSSRPTRPVRWAAALAALGILVAACGQLSASPSASGAMSPPGPSAPPTVMRTPSPTATASPANPPLALPLPAQRDPRQVTVTIQPSVAAGKSGTIVVTVTSRAATMIKDLVLRWATPLGDHLFLAPFVPSDARIAAGGSPLQQPWTKWVEGPGERGEPAGTTSLGWGPLLPGATLVIPLTATRRTAGPVAFDLQLLAGEQLLTLADGTPAALRIGVP